MKNPLKKKAKPTQKQKTPKVVKSAEEKVTTTAPSAKTSTNEIPRNSAG